jgi:hypothetical protein
MKLRAIHSFLLVEGILLFSIWTIRGVTAEPIGTGSQSSSGQGGYELDSNYLPTAANVSLNGIWDKSGIFMVGPDSLKYVPTPIPSITPEPSATSTQVPTSTNTPYPSPTSSPTPQPWHFPTLEEFTEQVRSQGTQGLWANGLFAFKFYYSSWGVVPDSYGTASYAGGEGYGAFFIHDYLGGKNLYSVQSGTRVAVIKSESINWFVITGVYRFTGEGDGTPCGYQPPFTNTSTGGTYGVDGLINTYYTAPFVIQTCICSDGVGGLLILNGTGG